MSCRADTEQGDIWFLGSSSLVVIRERDCFFITEEVVSVDQVANLS